MNDREARLRRLKIRSWRRGTKEMDLILGPFFDARGDALDEAQLTTYEALLEENDQDLYVWFAERAPTPDGLAGLMQVIRTYHAENPPKA